MSSFKWPPSGGGVGGVTTVNSLTGDVSIVAGQNATVTTNGQTITVGGFDPSTQVSLFEDFQVGYYSAANQQIFAENVWATVQTGLPTVVLNSGSVIPSTAANPGIIEFGTAGGAAYGAGLTTGAAAISYNQSFVIGGGEIIFEALIKIPVISDGTDNAQINIGFRDGPAWAGAVSAWNIQFQREASLNWQLLVIAASTQTTLDSGIAVTAGWHKLKMVANAAGTSISGFIDGVSMGAAVTTNIPTGSLPLMLTIRKTLGINDRYLGIDYLKIYKTLSVAR